MPELPELEAFCRYTKKELLSKTVADVSISMPSLLKGCTSNDLMSGINKKTITDVHRYGKLLILDFGSEVHVIMHFALRGELDVGRGNPRGTGITLYFTDGSYAHYVDLSCIGHVKYVSGTQFSGECRIADIYSLGPDALSEMITLKYFSSVFAGRSSPIKTVLMDQHVIAGIGNAYASEILFDAGILPGRSACSLNNEEIQRLIISMRNVLRYFIDVCARYCSVDYHLSVFEPQARKHLKVFHRAGLKCCNCGKVLETAIINGRAAFYCSSCQT